MTQHWTVDYEYFNGEQSENDFRVFSNESEAGSFASNVNGAMYLSDAYGNEIKGGSQ